MLPPSPADHRVVLDPHSPLTALGAMVPLRGFQEGNRPSLQAKLVPQKLPTLLLGEEVRARVLEVLADHQVVVLIKNMPFTLSLPAALQLKGSALHLRVSSLPPHLTFILLGEEPLDLTQDASVHVELSAASRYLTRLLGASADQSTPNRATKTILLNAALQSADYMAHKLRQGLERSGLFYEAHLGLWEKGQYPLAALAEEPQAKMTGLSPSAPAWAQLSELVERQLSTLENQPLSLVALAWPGQLMRWILRQDSVDERQEGGAHKEPRRWSTDVHVNLPYLGGVSVKLQSLAPNTFNLTFIVEQDSTATLIREQQAQLQAQFSQAGLQLNSLWVQHAV